ncbi:MAG: YeeE/YedE family protein [Magnetococcales bacterium]|nr:YeeE/YedE family protein [Magnetococcales bacterium]MBF0151036.1 YeeE/YedE family protein [Magnetococcales bacterium]MBF0173718.1 YeeE/YedE family protein [Magnetococcales bacterium]MBF0348893.1 YeeE/YedE family protein [Magnetococcales bacterium]MBF0632605.1 YeeE/YedE family protein [Magnetococcales bacterium]
MIQNLHHLHDDLRRLFQTPVSPFLGAALLALAVITLMAGGTHWGVFGGLRTLGDGINHLFGLNLLLGLPDAPFSPLHQPILISDVALIVGAMSAALIAGNHRLIRPPPMEYLSGAFGGILMGLGAAMAGGCTVGGFFTPLTFFSPSGWMMGIGLMAGAAIGIRLLLWAMEHLPWGKAPVPLGQNERWKTIAPRLGWTLLALTLSCGMILYRQKEAYGTLGLTLLVALFIGIILQRSRLCFSKAIREPFMTADGQHAKAVMLLLALVTPAAALLLQQGILTPYTVIPPRFWLGSLLGGICFGIGMVFAGGCATSTLWRLAEGNLKMLSTLFFFSWSGSVSHALLTHAGWNERRYDLDFLDAIPAITDLGYQAFLPDLTPGWGMTLAITYGMLLAWYLLVRDNERSERFTVF